MAKQLNINLGFTADISQAQANIQALTQSLRQISSIQPFGGVGLSKDLQVAVNSAKSLEQHLSNAFNTKTGNFDLNKLNLSLRQSGESLSALSAGLLRAGENGERAFMNVQKSLSTANVQITKSNSMLAQFANTLKNTARWQLSSSLLHGFISGLNQAINYSKDLDKSLNNIRIVTGYSADDMRDFAKSANDAAKALSSTTNEYAKASLIYFQQGLGSDEVKERTDATIKMANVSGQSAETVSDQMTAVWNNFDDGSKSLEYYADVMVKLGAETASSSDEIAGGLEKFAAVGKTIGLSYEYAAAALATITARTRQSEEVVGTALKTIFARIQGLKLGETLEDGVELNKYSEALQAVGISIFEQNGELKQMDSILNEMGAKWETLSKAQQVALAQTVAGVRQYTQLVALMDSWNDGQGSFQDNLQLAYDATGSLDKQQRTYEESWQAASKRIRASLEGIWEDLIPADSVIGITDFLAGLLEIVDRLIEGFGGLEGILMLVATIAINKMGPSIANGIDLAILKVQEFKQQLADQNLLSLGGIAQTIKTSFMNMFTPAATSAAQLRDNVQAIKYETDSLEKGMAFYNEHLKSGASTMTQRLQSMNAEAAAQSNLSDSFKQYLADTTQINNLQAMIEANKKRMTQADLDSLSALQSAATAAAERKAIEQETLELIELQISRQKMETDSKLYDSANYSQDDTSSSLMVRQVDPLLASTSAVTGGATGLEFWVEQINKASELGLQIETCTEGVRLYGDQWYTVGEASSTARDMVGDLHSLNLKLNDVISQPYTDIKSQNDELQQRKKIMLDIIKTAQKNGTITEDLAKRYTGMVNSLHKAGTAQKTFKNITNQILNGAKSMAKTLLNSEKNIEKTVDLRNKEHDAQQKVNQATSQHKNLIDQVVNGLNKGLSGLSTWGGQISKTLSGFSRMAMAINMVQNAIETLNDSDADFTSKLVSSTMALSMGFSALMPVIQGLVSGLSAYKAVQGGLIVTTTTYAGINKILAASETKTTLATALSTAAKKLGKKATEEEMAAELQSIIVDKLKVSSEQAEVIAKGLAVAWSKKSKTATDAETVANWANFASQMAKNWILLLVVAALALIAAATWAVVAAVKADNEEAKKNAEIMSELNEKTKELADSTQSLEGEIKSLIDTFNQQRAAGEDVSDTYNELVKKLNEVKQNYKKLNVSDSTMALLEQAEALGLATGNWEAYNKAQAQAQKEVKDEVGKQAEATTQANLKGAVAAFTDGQGDYEEDSGGKYVRRHVGNAGEDKEVSEILNKSDYAEIFKNINDDDATLRIDWDNESEFMEDYQLLANALRDMEIAGQTSNGTYQELKKEFDAMAEYAGEIEANMNAATEHRFQDKMKDLGLNAENIDTVDEYTYVLETLTDEMTNFFTSSEEARKKAKAFLGTFGNTAESAAAYNFVEKFGNKMKTAVNYKGVEGTQGIMTTNSKGQAVITTGTNPTIDVEAKYSEEQIQKEVQGMFNYIQGLPEDMRKIAMNIELDHIDSLEEFKTVFNKTKAFEAQVRIKADPQSVINSAKQIRDDLSEAMESFSEQGYLTTTQAIDFLDEFPQYSNYLKQTANGYAFTEEAIKEFNGALKDEKDALKELINPTNIGGQALYDFGKQLISLEAAVEDEGLKKFVTDMQDLTTQFIEGKIKSDEYFTALNDNINNLSFDENTSINDVMAFGNEVVPSMVSGIDSYLGAIDAAFEKGQIGAIEYRKALTSSANAVLKLEQKTRDAIKSTEKFSGIKFNEQTQQYERSAKWLGKVDQKTKDVVDSLNESLKRSKELKKVLKDMASFEGINVAATEDYEDLQKIFDEDFSIEIDDSELDAAIAKTQDYRDSIAEAFAALDSEAQQAVINKIGELGNKFDDTSGKAFNMSAETNTALSSIGVKAGTVSNEVEQAAVQMLNGTYTATAENSQLTAQAMGLILESGADTSQMVATMTGNVIDGIGRLVQNFDATIEIRSDGFGIDWQPFTFDILGKEFTINLPAPHFDIGFKGNLNGEAASAFNDIIGNLQGINTISSGKSGGGMSSFAPPSSVGNAGDVQLDEDPDGSGGGKNGGDKTKKQPKTEKPDYKDDSDKVKLEDELERYYYITNVIEDLNRELDSLSNAKDDAWGPNRIKAMDKEIAKLKQVRAATKQYADEIKTNLATDKSNAEEYGAVIGENGIISNYDALMAQWVNELNTAKVDNYNSYEDQIVALKNQSNAIDSEVDKDGSQKNALDEQISALEKQRDTEIQTAEETFEARKKALEQYEETRDLLADTNAELEEQLRQIQQLNYEKIMYKIEYKVEVNDRELEILDNKISRMEDDFYKTAEVMAKIQEKSKFYESGDEGILDDLEIQLNDLETAFKNGEITQADYIEGLGKIQDMAMDNVDALYEMNSQMREYYADVIDEGISKIQEMTDHFEHLTSKLQHYSSILGLMGHEQNYDLQNNLLQSQIDVLNDKIETSKATMAMLDSSLKSAQANYENATSEEDKEYWRERIVQISQALNEEEDAYLSYVEEVGDAANQILTNSIEKAFKEAELSMTNNLGFDSILADMERMNTLTDEFLTNTNKMYETNKMISSAQLAIDKTQNAQAKQKYQDYIKYIEQLQVSGNLTQTELQTAQARYKVLEAEIALEEAKNAKSEVRLTRDSEGNFGYVYTANQDEVANATQNYLDAQNELYNVGLENSKAYREKTVQLQQSTLEELKQLEIDFRVDHIISEEQYNQQKAAILETSNALLETYNEQFQAAQFTMATTSYNALMEEDTNFYNGQLSRNKEHTSLMSANDTEYYNGIKTTATETQSTLETNLANFNAGVLSSEDANYIVREARDRGYYSGLSGMALATSKDIKGIFNDNPDSLSHDLQVTFYGNLKTALSDCEGATRDWQTQMQPLVDAVGVSFDGKDVGLSSKIANTLQESKNLKDYITKKPDGLIDGIDKEWREVETATTKWTEHWQNIQNNVIPAYDTLIQRTQELIRAEAGEIANNPTVPEDPNANSGDGGSGGNGSGGGDGGTNAVEAQASTLASQAMEIVQKVHNGTIKQDSSGWKNNAKAAGYSDDAIALALKAFNDSKAGGGYSYYYDKALELVQSYDTGGYTGEWGPEGRMAMLHEKELVLNAKDTENFLTATSMLREISQMLDNNALLASLGMINLSAMTLNTEADKVLQQEVTIHADFPNVTDHNEIEMAIDNLINAASQYANKK